jgi:leader peptidase (prepilin peptidase) / N-methyltransferase
MTGTGVQVAQPPRSAGAATGRSFPVLAPAVVVVVALAILALPLDRVVVGAFGAAVLLVLAAIDLERGLIPNRIVLPSFCVVLLAQVIVRPDRASEWVLAALLAAFVLLVPNLIRPAWMGMGDVKLALLIGALLGWGAFGALLLAFLGTFPVALVLIVRGGSAARKSAIPFGPFLALGALIVLLGPYLADFPAN